MISGLRDPSVKWTDAQLAEALETVDQETDRLNRLVGNLLDASRLQIGALAVDIRPTSLNDTVASALQSLGVPPDGVVVDMGAEIPAVLGDPVLLERSLANIIGNAVRHSPPGKKVRVEAGTVGDAVHLRVVDRGPGIPVADPSAGDDSVPATRRSTNQRQRCRSRVLDRPGIRGRDARHVRARRHTGWRPDCHHHASEGHGARSMTKVLVVDDEPQIRRALSLNLGARDFDVIEATTGKAALAAVRTEAPDVMLLDLGLPDLDGLTVLGQLREWSDVAVIVLTARDDEESRLQAFELGADDYVTKPFDMAELVERISAAVVS